MGIFSRKPNVDKLLEEEDLSALVELLDYNDMKTRRKAVIALGRMGNKTCVPDLIKIIKSPGFLSSEGIAILGDVAWALGEIGDPKAKAPLRKLLKMEPGTAIGGAGSFDEMMQKAAQAVKTVEEVKQKATEALEKIG